MSRLAPISLDLLIGILIAFAGTFLKSTQISSYISIVIVFSTILPGVMLSGYSRKMSLGEMPNIKSFLTLCNFSLALNFILLSLFILIFKKNNFSLMFNISVALFFSISSICQTFNAAWFYLYKNKLHFFYVKLFSSSLRLLGIFLAITFKEIALIFLSMSLTQITETILGIKYTNFYRKKVSNKSLENNKTNLIYGFSQGLSRSTLSIIKIMIELFIGKILSTLLLFEQLVSGLSGIYERYFLGSKKKNLWIIFLLWIILIFGSYVFLYNESQETFKYKLLLALMASTYLIPICNMYEVMRLKGLLIIAKSLSFVSVLCLTLCFINYLWVHINFIYGLCYIIMPILLFFIYENLLKKD